MATASLEGAHAPAVDFPPAIRTALARVMGCDGGGLNELNYRERSLLARITRNVSAQDPTASIRVAVSTLAVALQTCNKTIQRTFGSLSDKGWIRRDQVKKRSGMQIADTWLTLKALEALGLVKQATSRAASDNMSGASRLSTMSKDSQQIPGPSVPEAEEKPLPEDLQLLEKVGLKRGAIYKLMSEATKAGHRLGNIVQGAAPLILKARYAFGYVRSLIASDKDWTNYVCAELRKREETAVVQAETQERDTAHELLKAAMANSAMLTNTAGQTVWLLRYEKVYACPVQDLGQPESKRRYALVTDLARMAEAIRSGKLSVYQPKCD
jgi:hypothetical protein